MRRGSMLTALGSMAVAAALSIAASVSVQAQQGLRGFDFAGYLAGQFPECAQAGIKPAVADISVLNHDFDGDGVEEAIVTASSCNTGTAGPDIHAAFRSDGKGGVIEIAIEDPATGDRGKIFAAMQGNRNYHFEVAGEELCAVFSDAAPVQPAARICYRLGPTGFAVTSAVGRK